MLDKPVEFKSEWMYCVAVIHLLSPFFGDCRLAFANPRFSILNLNLLQVTYCHFLQFGFLVSICQTSGGIYERRI